MEKITLQELIAINNAPKGRALIVKYGYEPARSVEDLHNKLNDFVHEFQEEALEELAKIHPDRGLILNYYECSCKSESKPKSDVMPVKRYSNFEYADEYIDFTGKAKESLKDWKDYLPLVAVAGVFAIAVVLIAKR